VVDLTSPGGGHGSRRVFTGAAARGIGEVIAKTASVAFYIMIARELGQSGFGDFIFGLSLSTVFFSWAGFGTEELITREVARDHGRLDSLFGNVIAFKTVLLIGLFGLMAAVVTLGGYPAETRVALLLIGLGTCVEVMNKTLYAVFQGYECQRYIASSLIVQRGSMAGVGIVALLAGAGLVEVGVIFFGAALLGLANSIIWLRLRVARPRVNVDPHLWKALAKAGAPLGTALLLYAILLRVDATLLSFLGGDDNADVGIYGAAFRLVEATMFVSLAFSGAVLPWFARQKDGHVGPLSQGFALALKAVLTALVPIAALTALLAEPIVDLLYGAEYADAVIPLRLLAGLTVLYGVNMLLATFLISRDRARDFAWPAAFVVVENIVANVILIPELGPKATALNAVVSGSLLAVLVLVRIRRLVGPISPVRTLTSVTAGAIALAAVVVGMGSSLEPIVVLAGLAAYCAIYMAIERLSFRDDLTVLVRAARRRPKSAEVT
jgi:O-antigen/teichoic acid export membrane protein